MHYLVLSTPFGTFILKNIFRRGTHSPCRLLSNSIQSSLHLTKLSPIRAEHTAEQIITNYLRNIESEMLLPTIPVSRERLYVEVH